MDRQRRPHAELRIGQAHRVTQGREHEQSDGIEREDRRERDAGLVRLRTDGRREGGDGAPAADRGAPGDERAGGAIGLEQACEQGAQREGREDRREGDRERLARGAQNACEAQPEAQARDGDRQELLAPPGGERVVRRAEAQGEQRAHREGEPGPDGMDERAGEQQHDEQHAAHAIPAWAELGRTGLAIGVGHRVGAARMGTKAG